MRVSHTLLRQFLVCSIENSLPTFTISRNPNLSSDIVKIIITVKKAGFETNKIRELMAESKRIVELCVVGIGAAYDRAPLFNTTSSTLH